MRVAIIGAAGRTGAATVEEARSRGHDVIAIARRPLPDAPGGTSVRVADATDEDAVRQAIDGADAVISAIGVGTSRQETDVYSRSARALTSAMATAGVDRLVAVSAAPVGPRSDHAGAARLALPILELFFGATYRDMRRMEAELAGSDLRWVALRPPRLLGKPARGAYRTGSTPPASGRSITIGDLATALVDVAEASEPTGPVYVSN